MTIVIFFTLLQIFLIVTSYPPSITTLLAIPTVIVINLMMYFYLKGDKYEKY